MVGVGRRRWLNALACRASIAVGLQQRRASESRHVSSSIT
jgi:hypothetical protein